MVKATEVTAGLAESNSSLLLGLWHDSLSHLQADCLYTGPNARENFTFSYTYHGL